MIVSEQFGCVPVAEIEPPPLTVQTQFEQGPPPESEQVIVTDPPRGGLVQKPPEFHWLSRRLSISCAWPRFCEPLVARTASV